MVVYCTIVPCAAAANANGFICGKSEHINRNLEVAENFGKANCTSFSAINFPASHASADVDGDDNSEVALVRVLPLGKDIGGKPCGREPFYAQLPEAR